jgi:hypothetical protein
MVFDFLMGFEQESRCAGNGVTEYSWGGIRVYLFPSGCEQPVHMFSTHLYTNLSICQPADMVFCMR